ncbi:molybdopterin converting factor subunit 1 [Rufibacter glacialis]|uniref:Molybdopterin synthase sulfur carrier subunit n=1 Tax=Rufibacter glacialis TaxID=1259555 RepID=A0A5M8QHM9_9BACT|nr:molybdopterin converting factor subunit 1 [Rufibacter glacialis]KAA6434323.1 molybdopterin converting factor subunit 1 [Rufibacter glacialis]GGK68577.1 molybdopterin synthase sulfur carrier subunit [Rufibacter glacialis]
MEILLFGITREIVGRNSLEVPSKETIQTVGQLKAWLGAQYPALNKLSSLAVAVDSEYAHDHQTLSPGQEVALIPPVSGG